MLRSKIQIVGFGACGLWSAGLILASGCSMCCGVEDYNYPAYGGLLHRSDSQYGRVGSIFSDPLAPAGVPAALGVEAPRNTPLEAKDSEKETDGGEETLPDANAAPDRERDEDLDKSGEELKKELLEDLKTRSRRTIPQGGVSGMQRGATGANDQRANPNSQIPSSGDTAAYNQAAYNHPGSGSPSGPGRIQARPTTKLQARPTTKLQAPARNRRR